MMLHSSNHLLFQILNRRIYLLLLIAGFLFALTPMIQVDVFLLLLPVLNLSFPDAHGAKVHRRSLFLRTHDSWAVPTSGDHSGYLLFLTELVLRDDSKSDGFTQVHILRGL
jgi:hypothetical protein